MLLKKKERKIKKVIISNFLSLIISMGIIVYSLLLVSESIPMQKVMMALMNNIVAPVK